MLSYDDAGNVIDDGQPSFPWVENNVEPLKITVNKAPPAWVDATPSPLLNPDASPADIAAYRLANLGKRHQNGPMEKTIIPEQDKRPSYVMEPDLQEAQGGMHLPPGMMQDDSGRLFYKDDPTTNVPVIKRPGLLPLANTPEGIKLVMPKMLDLASNVMGNVGGKVTAKAGEMVLGSGMVKKTADTPITIYRSEYTGNKGGKFWSSDPEFAVQFTQTGQHKELLKRTIKPSEIYKAEHVYAGDPDAVDKVLAEAKAKGFKAVELNEGQGQPNSIRFLSDTRNQVAGEIGHQIEKGAFYSQLERTVKDAKINLATPEQWLGYLKNQPGVKSEEINTVLKDLPKDGMLSKAEIENYVKQNKVELKEKVLGNINDSRRLDLENKVRNGTASKDEIKEFENILDTQNHATKYHQYQLPGGENYKEILLSLPEKKIGLIGEGRNRKAVPDPGDVNYKAPHFVEHGTNLIGHLRTNERMIGEGYVIKNKESGNTSQVFNTKDEAQKYYDNLSEGMKRNAKLEIVGSSDKLKGTHIEELQSDWGQGIRKHGYKGEKEKLQPEFDKIEKKIVDSNDETVMGQPKIEDALKLAFEKKLITKAEADTYKRYTDIENGKPLPDMPFKKNWDELLLKKAIHSAVEKGHDFISWTPGEAQAARYDLSKHVNNINIVPTSSNAEIHHITINGTGGVIGSGTIDKNGKIIDGYNLLREAKDKNISDVVGKEVAEKIIQKTTIPFKRPTELPEGYELIKDGKKWGVTPPGQNHARSLVGLHDTKEEALRQTFNHIHSTEAGKGHTLENVDLKIGGEGMKTFYDKMLVNRANAIGKKYGAKVEQKELPKENRDYYVEEVKLPTGRDRIERKPVYDVRFKDAQGQERFNASYPTKAEAEAKVKELNAVKGQSIHYMELTPELEKKAKEGFELFSSSPTIVPVDHDPFKEQKKKTKLVPVSHDPFK